MKRMARLILPLGFVAVAMIACRGAEGLTDPPATTSTIMSVVGPAYTTNGVNKVGDDMVKPLLRNVPNTQRIEVSAYISSNGGELAIPQLGAKLVFPPGTLRSRTLITMVAPPGKQVAYQFYPHMDFKGAEAYVQQDLSFTNAANDEAMKDAIIGAFFDGDLGANLIGQLKNNVKVKEIRAGSIDRTRTRMAFSVVHFSGYLASSGRVSSPDE